MVQNDNRPVRKRAKPIRPPGTLLKPYFQGRVLSNSGQYGKNDKSLYYEKEGQRDQQMDVQNHPVVEELKAFYEQNDPWT
jgi:hypothetical protein